MVRFILLVVAAVILGGASGARAAEEDPQCMDNGKCCAELNQFWGRITTKVDPSKITDPDRLGDAHFELIDSTKYKWDRILTCPSKQSKIAEAFKIIYDMRKNENATLDYYEFVRKTAFNSGYGFTILDSDHTFALVNPLFYAIAVSYSNIDIIYPTKLASYIIHEATHVHLGERGHHVVCQRGQRKGHNSCDQKLANDLSSDGGVITWQVFFLNDYLKNVVNKNYKQKIQRSIYTLIHDMVNGHPKYGPDGVTPLKKYYGVDKLP